MRFKKIYIEITNQCNLSCSFCQPHKRKLSFMKPEVFLRILEEIQPYTNYIYLHVMGEPLLHPQLHELLHMAKQHGFYVNMTSNCVLLPNQVEVLKGNIRQLNMSLHSKPKQDGIHQANYIEECLRIGDLLAEAKTYISYRMWNLQEGSVDEESKDVLQHIASHYECQLTPGINQKLAPRRFLHFEETFAWPNLQCDVISTKGTCYGMRAMCAILVDGSVVPCCLDGRGECVLGNINTQSFESILLMDKTKQMIEGFQHHEIVEPLCQRCGYRTRFEKEGSHDLIK